MENITKKEILQENILGAVADHRHFAAKYTKGEITWTAYKKTVAGIIANLRLYKTHATAMNDRQSCDAIDAIIESIVKFGAEERGRRDAERKAARMPERTIESTPEYTLYFWMGRYCVEYADRLPEYCIPTFETEAAAREDIYYHTH